MYTIEATLVNETEKAYLLDCEGDEHWFPKSQVKFNKETNTLSAPGWLLKQKFPEEDFK